MVPRFLRIDDVVFPLMLGDDWVGLSAPPNELKPLIYVAWEVVNGEQRDVPLAAIASEGFHVQELNLLPIDPDQAHWYVVDMLHWRRLSGTWPTIEESFSVSTGFTQTNLVMPRRTVLSLFARLRELRDKLGPGEQMSDEPVPPPPPIDPALGEFYRLWNIDRDDARRYALELHARRA